MRRSQYRTQSQVRNVTRTPTKGAAMSRTNNPLMNLRVKSATPDPRADLAELVDPPVVVVTGSRACTAYGEHVTQEIVSLLCAEGATIVTGGAYGIDAVAMRTAAERGGRNIVVQANGLDKPMPVGHAALFQHVLHAGGVLVSEYPNETPPTKAKFLERIRLMMSSADAVVLVEAASRSGALHGVAAVPDVPVYAIPGPVTSAQSSGTNQLIRQGRATLLTPDALSVRQMLADATR